MRDEFAQENEKALIATNDNKLIIFVEFEYGSEERPRVAVKLPVTFEAAIIAVLLSVTEDCCPNI